MRAKNDSDGDARPPGSPRTRGDVGAVRCVGEDAQGRGVPPDAVLVWTAPRRQPGGASSFSISPTTLKWPSRRADGIPNPIVGSMRSIATGASTACSSSPTALPGIRPQTKAGHLHHGVPGGLRRALASPRRDRIAVT